MRPGWTSVTAIRSSWYASPIRRHSVKPCTACLARPSVHCSGVAWSPNRLPTFTTAPPGAVAVGARAVVRPRLPAAVHHAPEDDVEHPVEALHRHLGRLAEDRHRGVVHPGVEAVELSDRGRGGAGDVLLAGHVGGDGDELPDSVVKQFGDRDDLMQVGRVRGNDVQRLLQTPIGGGVADAGVADEGVQVCAVPQPPQDLRPRAWLVSSTACSCWGKDGARSWCVEELGPSRRCR